ECKQEGYEFCHNRKVLTLFSASNYYDVGSNRGAYVKLGPQLVPYVVQYQATSRTRELTVRQSVGQTELSALRILREQLFSHKSDLICLVSLSDWVLAVEGVMGLGLPWRMLRRQLISRRNPDGTHIEQGLLETLYRHRSTLETIFRIVDTDNSGVITMEDFRQTWKLLSVYLKMEFTDEAIDDLAVAIDSNRDGSIDIHEFMEAFRLTDKKSRLERGRSMFMGTATDLTALETAGETARNTALQSADLTALQSADLTAMETAGETTSGSELWTHRRRHERSSLNAGFIHLRGLES
ncbi:hypothetical protein CRUP_006879, partial [Coryphaenoides rupestris]